MKRIVIIFLLLPFVLISQTDHNSVTFKVYQDQQICLVGVDSATQKHKITWVGEEGVGTDYYMVFKAIAMDEYAAIGVVDHDQPHEFIDTSSHPESYASIYKITVTDTFGYQSDLNNCAYHKTMNLVLSYVGTTVYLNWEQYEVEDGGYVPSLYYIYKGTHSDSLFLYDSISGSYNSYNDLDVTGAFYYKIGIKRTDCETAKDGPSYAFSIIHYCPGSVNIIQHRDKSQVLLYPNPAKDKVYFNIPQKEKGDLQLRITDVTGKQLSAKQYSATGSYLRRDLDVEGLAPGVYLVELKGKRIYKGKLIVE